jgi:steroid delta-isomerase-like uncharacterized protein
MSDQNKELVRRSWELLRDLDILEEVYAPDLVWHEPDQDIRGVAQAKEFVRTYLSAFPDLTATVEDVLAEGDKVVTRWTLRGTHQGELMGIAPTGKQIEFKGITIHRIAGGKIVEEWEGYDNLGVMREIGAVAAPGESAGA